VDEDGYIIYKCINGETEAFGFLVDKYKESVYAFAYSKLHNFEDAEDVTQEVFLNAYKNLRRLRRWDSFLGWLYSITSNLCKNLIRSRSRHPDNESMEEQALEKLNFLSLSSYREKLAQESLSDTIGEAMDSLPETYQLVLTLHYMSGMSNKEIARFLGTSVAAVKQRMNRARFQLKEEILNMMSKTFDENRLHTGFTFHIVKAIEKIKLQPALPADALPWGLSIATGIIIAFLGISSFVNIFNPIDAIVSYRHSDGSAASGFGNIPVDFMKISQGMDLYSNIVGYEQEPSYTEASVILAPSRTHAPGKLDVPEKPNACLGKGLSPVESFYSPDGKLIAFPGGSNVWLYNAVNLKEVGSLANHNSLVTSIAFSPDGNTLVSIGKEDRIVRFWDVKTQKEISRISGEEQYQSSISYSPDGKLIAVAGGWRNNVAVKTIRLWDVKTKEKIAELAGHTDMIGCVSFSPDGKLLASGSMEIYLWDMKTLKEVAVIKDVKYISSLSFSPDGNILTAGYDDKVVRLWDINTKSEIAALHGHTDRVYSTSFSPDGKMLVTAGLDNTIRLWNMETKAEIAILNGHNGAVTSISISPDGKSILTTSWDNTIRVWDIENRIQAAVISGFTTRIWSISVQPNGKLLASGEERGIRLWNMETLSEIKLLTPDEGGLARAVSFSPDSKLLASSCSNMGKTIILLDTEKWDEIARLEGHSHLIRQLSFSPDGKILASASADKTIKLWDIEKRKEFDRLKGHNGEVVALAFSPDGKLLASGGQDNTIRLWEVKSGKELAVLMGHFSIVCDIEFISDGKTLISGGYDATIRFWDIQDLKKPVEIERINTQPVETLCLSPDGKILVSGERNNKAKIWDMAEKKLLGTLPGHGWPLSSLAFTPDGKWLATGSYDGTILIWEMNLDVLPEGKSVEPTGKKMGLWGEIKQTALLQNFPNPFNPETWIPYSLSETQEVVFKIYNSAGQLIRVLNLGRKLSGVYLTRDKAAYWDGKDERGDAAASDVYFYVMESGKYTEVRKMVMVR